MTKQQFYNQYRRARTSWKLSGVVSGYSDRAVVRVMESRDQAEFSAYWNSDVLRPCSKMLRPFY